MLSATLRALVATSSCLAIGQEVPTKSLLALLPRGAKIIETADLSSIAAKPRIIVLWMLNPKPSLTVGGKWTRNNEDGYCSDIVHGDFGMVWRGPTRLSLVDAGPIELLNTVEIHTGCAGCGSGRDRFIIPHCVLNPYPRKKESPSDKHGKPNLDLRDYTGEGIRAEFALFIFEAFGITSTGVFGYDPKTDRVIQFPVELLRPAKKPLTTMWTEQVFAREPIRPGYWKFTWRPGHGSGDVCDEEVSFDLARRIFVQKQHCWIPKNDR